MLKRIALLGILTAEVVLLQTGCRKSEGTQPPKLFGASPKVSEVSITKQSKHFECDNSTPLCCVDPPICDCCCVPDTVDRRIADLDFVEVSARVSDPDGVSDLLVVLLRFLDPPKDGTPAGTQLRQISLEMFDVGQDAVGQQSAGSNLYPILSGDLTKGDGIYTRKFYFKSTTLEQSGTCIQDKDLALMGGVRWYEVRDPSGDPYVYQQGTYAPDSNTRWMGSAAMDRAGNIASSSPTVLPIIKSQVVAQSGILVPCGPPTGNGGCQPGTP